MDPLLDSQRRRCRVHRRLPAGVLHGNRPQGRNLDTPDLKAALARSEARSSFYSHSIVPGGFEVTSYTTRLTPFTSFTIRVEIIFSTSYGSATQSAVIPSSELTARIAQVYAYVRMSPITPT